MSPERDWTDFIARLRADDPLAWQEFCVEYGERLERLIDSRLPRWLRTRLDPDSVRQSVYRTFWRRMKQGQFRLQVHDELWKLLCTLAVRKTIAKSRREGAAQRDARRTTGGDEPLSHQAGAGASAEAVQAALENLIESLDERIRDLLLLYLENHTQVEIAERMEMSERWVREAFKQLRERLTGEALEA